MKAVLVVLFSFFIAALVFSQQKDQGLLPVELTYFNAVSDGNIVYLNWGTATETNNYGYDVERASEDKFFEWIGFVPGNGNSFSPKYYSFIDTSVTEKGVFYYRLKQIDTDGAFEFSDTAAVNVNIITEVEYEHESTDFILYQNYPNPFNSGTNIRFYLPHDAFVRLNVFDAAGAEVMCVLSEMKRAGYHNAYLQMGDLTSGFYFYKLSLNVSGFSRTFVCKSFVFLK